MRISDWSSDVCSSDLERILVCLVDGCDRTARRAGRTIHPEPEGAGGLRPGLLHLELPVRPRVGSGGAVDGLGRHTELVELAGELLRDRKSVVSGTRVSVRVDLVGCRIIKKKTK